MRFFCVLVCGMFYMLVVSAGEGVDYDRSFTLHLFSNKQVFPMFLTCVNQGRVKGLVS